MKEKISQLKIFWEKLKLWVEKAGFVSLIYLLLGVLTLMFGKAILGIVLLGWVAKPLGGAFLGIFCYLNWNVIRKLWKENVSDKL